MKCEYCNSSIIEADKQCENCGAPVAVEGSALPDFRTCPSCQRKLVALGSPACNYCGRRLPDNYIKAREADLKRLSEMGDRRDSSELSAKVGELVRNASRGGHASSGASVLDVPSLLDLLS